eukprot:m.352557 g.352557  ORF g.352557 m.352557 type:complete len:639 (-) comp19903_c6_seq3:847-2763(-)
MGETLGKLFVDPSALPGGDTCNATHFGIEHDFCDQKAFGGVQVFFLMAVYGYVLSWASNLISDGSELLLLVPSMRGIVGTVVLPILGAVPDGAIVLFSGLGDDAVNQVGVGVGALAGSTIMLLTIPWGLAIIAGRVDLKQGRATYIRPFGRRRSSWMKLQVGRQKSCTSKLKAQFINTGVTPNKKVTLTGKIMLATALTYLIIQGPAFAEHKKHAQATTAAHYEHYYALIGMISCFLLFAGYLYYQVKYADISDNVDKAVRSAIASQIITASKWLAIEMEGAAASHDEMEGLLSGQDDGKREERIRRILRPFFNRYDMDNSGTIDVDESRVLLRDLGADELSKQNVEKLLAEMDKDGNRVIDFDEFVLVMKNYIKHSQDGEMAASSPQRAFLRRFSDSMAEDYGSVQAARDRARLRSIQEGEEDQEDVAMLTSGASGPATPTKDIADAEQGDQGGDEDDEEAEMPEEFLELDPRARQRAILMRAFRMMGIGTIVVLLFSDPMVDVLDSFGKRINVPSFFVAFVMAPLASNASELIAAYSYAQKKTQKTVTVSFSTLLGAAIMNNTFCLGIFLVIIYLNKKIAWTFSAETLSILLIELAMGLYAHKKTHRLLDAVIIFSLYPLSLVFVILVKMTGIDDL